MEDPSPVIHYLDRKARLIPDTELRIGRDQDNTIVLPHTSVSRFHAVVEWSRGAPTLRDLESTNGTLVNYERCNTHPLSEGDRITIGPFVLVYRLPTPDDPETAEHDRLIGETLMIESGLSSVLDQIRDPALRDRIVTLKHLFNRSRQRLHGLANHDRLTGLHNRTHFDETLKQEVDRAHRYDQPLSLIMLDIDRFKGVNDIHGHQKGDQVLAAMATLLRENTRASDVTSRYGGEEFAVILPQANAGHAAAVAEKIRAVIESQSKDAVGLRITVSLGVAALSPDGDGQSLVERADGALYASKRAGRNRYTLAP